MLPLCLHPIKAITGYDILLQHCGIPNTMSAIIREVKITCSSSQIKLPSNRIFIL